MFNSKNPEVLIAGAGPVGLFAALALTKRGIRVEIADKGWRAGTHSYALALHPQSLGLFQELGLLDKVMQHARTLKGLSLCDDAGEKARIEFEGFPGTWSQLAVLRQDTLEDLLEQALREAGVNVLWSHEVFGLSPESGHVSARVDKFEKDSMGYSVARTEWVLAKTIDYDVAFVLGADGHRSRVRRALKIDYPEVANAQHYAVFEFQTDADLGDQVRIVMGDHATDVLWPLPGGYCRWSFEMPDYQEPVERQKDRLFGGASTSEFPVLAEASLREFIAQRAPWFKGSIGEILWRNVVRFEKRLAASFGSGRMWLAGDAAHLAGPAGVQSMNLGIAEAANFAAIAARVLRDGAPLTDFDAYNQRWSREWSGLLGVKSGLHAGTKAQPWVAARAGRILSCLPAHGEELDLLTSQIDLHMAATAAG